MSVAATPQQGEERFLLGGMSWSFYEHLLAELNDRPVFVTYDRGNMELMVPSYPHERYRALLGGFLQTLVEEHDLPMICGGMTTFRRDDFQRGLEPDDCFYIHNVGAILSKQEIDLRHDPPPDLAVEIKMSRSALDRLDIYAALGVREVWRFDGETLRVHCLQAEGTYSEDFSSSPTFPHIPLDGVVEFLKQCTTTDDTSLNRRFRSWVQGQIAGHANNDQ